MIRYVDITREGLHVKFCEKFIPEQLADNLYEKCLNLFKDSTDRRSTMIFGDDDIQYHVEYKNYISSNPTNHWSSFPVLDEVKKIVEAFNEQKYNFCCIVAYPDGNYGIKPHQDKEMTLGTTICGLSVGAKRMITFYPPYQSDNIKFSIDLPHGSLYCMLPPTNQNWRHEIPLQPDIKDWRFSFTFRNMKKEDIDQMEEKINLPFRTCKELIKTGKRKGEECGNKIHQETSDKCGIHNR